MNLAVTLDKLSKEGEEERQEAYLAEAVPAMREALATGQEDPEQRALLETWVDQRERRLWQYGWRRRQALPPRERLAALEPLIAELGPGGYGPMVASLHAQRAGAWASLAGTLEGSEERDAWDRAITARRVVVAAWPRDEFPEKWGNAQVKLGSALRSRGALPGVEDRPRWFGEAAAAYRAALEVRSRVVDPEAWAEANNELAATLIPHADFVDPAERPVVLREAVAAMKRCLEVWTAESKPELHSPRQAWLEQAEAELAAHAAAGGEDASEGR